MQPWLARPSIGGAVRESFKASPTSPVIAFFFARGCTFTAKQTPALPSSILIMVQFGVAILRETHLQYKP